MRGSVPADKRRKLLSRQIACCNVCSMYACPLSGEPTHIVNIPHNAKSRDQAKVQYSGLLLLGGPPPLPRGTYIVDPPWPHSSTSGITSSGTPWIAWGQTLDRMQEYGGDEHLITQSYLLKYIIRRLFYAPPPEHYRTAKLSRLPESGKVLQQLRDKQTLYTLISIRPPMDRDRVS